MPAPQSPSSAFSVALATIYGRYHFAVDALA